MRLAGVEFELRRATLTATRYADRPEDARLREQCHSLFGGATPPAVVFAEVEGWTSDECVADQLGALYDRQAQDGPYALVVRAGAVRSVGGRGVNLRGLAEHGFITRAVITGVVEAKSGWFISLDIVEPLTWLKEGAI